MLTQGDDIRSHAVNSEKGEKYGAQRHAQVGYPQRDVNFGRCKEPPYIKRYDRDNPGPDQKNSIAQDYGIKNKITEKFIGEN